MSDAPPSGGEDTAEIIVEFLHGNADFKVADKAIEQFKREGFRWETDLLRHICALDTSDQYKDQFTTLENRIDQALRSDEELSGEAFLEIIGDITVHVQDAVIKTDVAKGATEVIINKSPKNGDKTKRPFQNSGSLRERFKASDERESQTADPVVYHAAAKTLYTNKANLEGVNVAVVHKTGDYAGMAKCPDDYTLAEARELAMAVKAAKDEGLKIKNDSYIAEVKTLHPKAFENAQKCYDNFMSKDTESRVKGTLSNIFRSVVSMIGKVAKQILGARDALKTFTLEEARKKAGTFEKSTQDRAGAKRDWINEPPEGTAPSDGATPDGP